ncbi:DUF3103 family protein [Vibrio gazogenes]|uniref:Uncharacterized protein n=1 Tax=Vibrio gazogenes DSM 21264 = NBRC 103151 TaxID=1123492 RepID=A0A1M4TA26_VIBGA|nr:DUF3103 family protein [Vibrio gazogenes]USP16049.1 DUF3103 domain-containing protein [Vibrio gazogenes]SHE41204.1 Protein of unknown function [Vibrio gazogenes DSM 21264] [Vibrio gazogenes DSM 21264 = NBRC 103151]SJN54299.1 hypothetical protein BQ6471_00936 [Vibrio gazogenes]
MKLKNTIAVALCAVASFISVNAFAVDKDAIAARLASQLHDSVNLNQQIKQIERSQTPIRVNTFLAPQGILSSRSIGGTTEMWLFLPSDRALNDDMSDLVVAYPPSGDEDSWTQIVGYTLSGDKVSLAVDQEPDVPVLVVDDNGYYAMKESVKKLNTLLQENGLQEKTAQAPRLSTQTEATGFDATKLTKVNVNNVHEPWIKGAAEIYGIVSGVLTSNKPQILVVEMPYLDNKETNYYPNQIVINWSEYDYRVVDMLMYEHDSGTNYKTLVQALVTAVGAAGSLAGWPPSSAIAEITSRVIAAMPDSVFVDDDDFVDACYTLERGKSYADFHCSADNAVLSMAPFFVESNVMH